MQANRRDLNPTKGPLFDKSVATARVKMELDGLDPCLGKPAAKGQEAAAAPIPQVKTAEGTENQTSAPVEEESSGGFGFGGFGFGSLITATADSTQECENLRAQVRDLEAQLQAAGIKVSTAEAQPKAWTEPYTPTAEPDDTRMECINCRCLYTEV